MNWPFQQPPAAEKERQDHAGRPRPGAPPPAPRRPFLALILFTALSLAARLNFLLPQPLPPDWRQLLGQGPPPTLVSVALLVYTFAALILILARMAEGVPSFRGWSQLAYLGAFYLFYALTDSLADNFWAVFAAGFTILGLEYFHHWNLVLERQREG